MEELTVDVQPGSITMFLLHMDWAHAKRAYGQKWQRKCVLLSAANTDGFTRQLYNSLD